MAKQNVQYARSLCILDGAAGTESFDIFGFMGVVVTIDKHLLEVCATFFIIISMLFHNILS